MQAVSAPASPRPTWRDSEGDVGKDLGADARRQVSFKDGTEENYGTPGSVRPDFVINGNIASVEVKNYNIETNINALINNVAVQAIEREKHLPEGMEQRIIIDIRGQGVNLDQRGRIVEGIVDRSSGVLTNESIEFKE